VKRSWSVVIVVIVILALPCVALARRLATKRQHDRVVAAAVAAHDISKAQGRCARVFISTANTDWASLDFPAAATGKPRSCLMLAANGIALFHYRHGQWRFVTVGSDFPTCPPKGVPRRVAHDLRIC
jgi:hypothetical protein